MTERMRLYNKLTSFINRKLPSERQSHRQTFAMFVFGLLIGERVHLPRICSRLPLQGKKETFLMRLYRFLKLTSIDNQSWYFSLLSDVFELDEKENLTVIVDVTAVGPSNSLWVAALPLGNRAIPLFWRSFEQKKGHLKARLHLQSFRELQRLLKGKSITLLADAEFDMAELLRFYQQQNWEFVCRTSPNYLFGTSFQRVDSLKRLGKVCWNSNTSFLSGRIQEVTVAAWWHKNYKAPIYLVSSLSSGLEAGRLYLKRFQIETIFGDVKSRGFRLEQTKIKEPRRIERLVLVVCFAFVWLTSLGVEVLESPLSRLQEKHSLFRLGIDYVEEFFNFGGRCSLLDCLSVPIEG